MPELPEVETVCRGLEPLLTGRTVAGVVIRTSQLRWPIDPSLDACLSGQRIESLARRAKYLLLNFTHGTLLLHLGMSGVVRVVESSQPAGRHDHVDILLDDGHCLRLNDPRRFGAILWAGAEPLTHPLLRDLGPEPLSAELNGDVLFARSRGRKLAVKAFVMDQKIVVGVGNIYASEALFRAGVNPLRPAGDLDSNNYVRLAQAIKAVLAEAIAQGGTTLRDFSDAHGRPGYFAQSLRVYGRAEQPCLNCGTLIRSTRIGGRASYHCPRCQK